MATVFVCFNAYSKNGISFQAPRKIYVKIYSACAWRRFSFLSKDEMHPSPKYMKRHIFLNINYLYIPTASQFRSLDVKATIFLTQI